MTNLDERDKTILRYLQEDGRMTWAELARKMNMSAPAVLARVRRLEVEGYIRGYVALVNRQKVGKDTTAYVRVSLVRHGGASERFEQEIIKLPEVLEGSRIMGEYDYILKIIATSNREVENFVNDKLASIRDVSEVRIEAAIRDFVERTKVPMNGVNED